MANDSNTLEFRIVTHAELAGAQAAAEALERQIGKAKALRQDYSDLQKQLDLVNASLKEANGGSQIEQQADAALAGSQKAIASEKEEIQVLELLKRQRAEAFAAGADVSVFDRAIQNLTPSLGHAGHGFGSARIRAELFRRSLMSVGAYIPGLEWAVYGLGTSFGTITAAVIGGSIAVEYFIKHLEAAKIATEKLAEEQRKFDNGIWFAQRDAIDEAKESAQEYADAIAHAGEQTDIFATKEDQEKQVLDARLQAQKQLLEAMEKEELAQLNRKNLTPEQKQIGEAEIKTRYEGLQSDFAAAQEQAQLDLLQKQKDRRRRAEPELRSKSDATQKQLDNEKINQAAIDAKSALDTKFTKDARAKLLKAEADAGDAKKLRAEADAEGTDPSFVDVSTDAGIVSSETPAGYVRDAAAKAEAAAKALADFDTEEQKNKDIVLQHNDELKKLTAAHQKAYEAYSKNIEAVNRYTDEINTASAIQKVHQKAALDIAVESNKPGLAAKTIADEISSGKKVDRTSDEFVTSFADDLFHRLGQLNPGENFKSGEAAATAIENFFKTQTDPYNRVFQAIHNSVSAGNSKVDSLANYWEQRFLEMRDHLQSQITRNANYNALH